MKFLGKLILRARKALEIFRGRYVAREEEFFLEQNAAARALQRSQQNKNKTLFDFLKETYVDIADSDPEAALLLLKEELESSPEPPVEEALVEIEKYIREMYCREYFGGMRVKAEKKE